MFELETKSEWRGVALQTLRVLIPIMRPTQNTISGCDSICNWQGGGVSIGAARTYGEALLRRPSAF
eukprot:1191775-Prorocentrum_minimum.AAC.1